MSADGTPWNDLNDAGAARLRPDLPARVLAQAARLRAEALEARRGLRTMALCAATAALVLAGYHQFFTRPIAEARIAQWNRVVDWTTEFAAN